MNLTELKSFQAIIEEGNFTKAAKKLNYTQSSITKHIKKLEDEFGLKLFAEGKNNQLTPEGELLKKEARSLIIHWESVQRNLLNSSENIQTVIKIGFVQPYDKILLPDILEVFKKKYKKARVQIIVGSTSELAEALKQNKIDFALCSLPHDNKFIYKEITKEKVFLVSSITNAKNINNINKLKNAHIYRSDNGCPQRRKIENYIDSSVQGINWEIANNISTIPYLIEKNNYFSFLPFSIIKSSQARIKIIPVYLPDNLITLGILSLHILPSIHNILMRIIIESVTNFTFFSKD